MRFNVQRALNHPKRIIQLYKKLRLSPIDTANGQRNVITFNTLINKVNTHASMAATISVTSNVKYTANATKSALKYVKLMFNGAAKKTGGNYRPPAKHSQHVLNS